jgi:hypothetical protein
MRFVFKLHFNITLLHNHRPVEWPFLYRFHTKFLHIQQIASYRSVKSWRFFLRTFISPHLSILGRNISLGTLFPNTERQSLIANSHKRDGSKQFSSGSEGKAARAWSYFSPTSSSEVKNEESSTSTHSYAFTVCTGRTVKLMGSIWAFHGLTVGPE